MLPAFVLLLSSVGPPVQCVCRALNEGFSTCMAFGEFLHSSIDPLVLNAVKLGKKPFPQALHGYGFSPG